MPRIEYEGTNLSDLFQSFFGVSPAVAVQYSFTTCCACGTPFAIEAALMASLRKTGKGFYCPNGHSLTFGENETDKLKKQLAVEAKKREQLETQVRQASNRASAYREQAEATEQRLQEAKGSLAATKGVVTRLKKRAANGACPCCNRHFSDLQRHMTSKHPDFATKEEAEVSAA